MAKCIICDKKLNEATKINKHDVQFCSEECLKKYEEKLKELNKDINWDSCC